MSTGIIGIQQIYTEKLEYYLIKKNKEHVICEATDDLEIIIISEVTQEKDKYHMIAYIMESQKQQKN